MTNFPPLLFDLSYKEENQAERITVHLMNIPVAKPDVAYISEAISRAVEKRGTRYVIQPQLD